MGDVRSGMGNVSAHLGQDTLVVVAVEQRVLVLALGRPGAGAGAGRMLVGFEAGLLQHDDEPARVVALQRRLGLLRDETWVLRRGRGRCGSLLAAAGDGVRGVRRRERDR